MKGLSRRGVVSVLGALSLAGGTLVLTGLPAGAAAPKVSDKCAAIGKGTISKCTSDLDNGVSDATEKGGHGTVTRSATTITIVWAAPYEGSTAAAPAKTVFAYKTTPPNPDESETKTCPTGTTELNLTGKIMSDTTDPAGNDTDVGGLVKGEICVNGTTGQAILEPGTVLKFLDPAGG